MTIDEANEFYKNDQNLYNVEKNKDFLKWLKKQVKSGYNPYLSTKQIQQLIDYIALWYEIKYPERELQKDEGIMYPDFNSIEDISSKLDIDQLIYRLPDTQMAILQCPYRAYGGGVYSTYEDGKRKDEMIAFMSVYRKPIKNNEYTYPRELKKFLVRIYNKTGVIIKDFEIEKYFKENRDIKIEELKNIFEREYSDVLNFDEIIECVSDHKIDLELRNEILNMVALKLLYSKNTVPIMGYIRAKKFIYDFNNYFNLNISTTKINELINKYYSVGDPERKKEYYLK